MSTWTRQDMKWLVRIVVASWGICYAFITCVRIAIRREMI